MRFLSINGYHEDVFIIYMCIKVFHRKRLENLKKILSYIPVKLRCLKYIHVLFHLRVHIQNHEK